MLEALQSAGSGGNDVSWSVLHRDDELVSRAVDPGITFTTAPERGSFDVVALVHVVHEWTPAQAARNLAYLAARLKPGGTLLIVDSGLLGVRTKYGVSYQANDLQGVLNNEGWSVDVVNDHGPFQGGEGAAWAMIVRPHGSVAHPSSLERAWGDLWRDTLLPRACHTYEGRQIRTAYDQMNLISSHITLCTIVSWERGIRSPDFQASVLPKSPG